MVVCANNLRNFYQQLIFDVSAIRAPTLHLAGKHGTKLIAFKSCRQQQRFMSIDGKNKAVDIRYFVNRCENNKVRLNVKIWLMLMNKNAIFYSKLSAKKEYIICNATEM